MEGLAQAYAPYSQTGYSANEALQRLLSDPSSVRSLPGYAFDQEEGIQALDRSAAAGGRLNSGRQAKDLLRFGTGLADKTYGDHLQRLMSGTALGLGATQAGVNTQAQGLQGQLGARTSAYQGDMTSAGTIGQGIIAAQNSENAGAKNVMDIGMTAVGALMGLPPGGGSYGWKGNTGYAGWLQPGK